MSEFQNKLKELNLVLKEKLTDEEMIALEYSVKADFITFEKAIKKL